MPRVRQNLIHPSIESTTKLCVDALRAANLPMKAEQLQDELEKEQPVSYWEALGIMKKYCTII